MLALFVTPGGTGIGSGASVRLRLNLCFPRRPRPMLPAALRCESSSSSRADPLVPEEGDIGDGDADARGTYRWTELEVCAALELERESSVVEVVFIAYGWEFGVFGTGLLGEG